MMDFTRALEILGRFQEAYETLFRINGQDLEAMAAPYIECIEYRKKRENCSAVEAVLIILKECHQNTTIPMSALTIWLLASAVILEEKAH